MKYRLPSMAGFGRKLIVFLLVDAVLAGLEVLWEKRTIGAFFLLLALRSPMSVILAAIWNAIDKG
jgi:hypothetical protein